MKKLFTLIALLGLCVSGAWAEVDEYGVNLDDYTKTTYDFTTMNGTTLVIDKTASPTSVWSTKLNSTINVYPCTTSGLTDFAFEEAEGDAWKFYNANGLCNFARVYSGAIKAKNGNIVVFVYTRQGAVTIGNTAVGTGPYVLGEEQTTTAQNGTDVYNGRYWRKATMNDNGVIGFCMNKWSSSANAGFIRQIIVYKSSAVCQDPSYNLTGAYNNSRKFTLSCVTDGAEIYYSESELTTATGGTKYTGEVTTSATTIWAYAKTATLTSDVINFETGAGSTLTLNAPTYSRKSYSAGRYTISLSHNQSTVLGASDAVIKYSVDGGAVQTYSSDFSVEAGSVITAYSEKAGYTKSSDVIISTAVRPTNLILAWTQDYTQITKNDGNGNLGVVLSSEVDFTVGTRNFYNITGYTVNSEPKNAVLNTNVGINTDKYFSLRCNGSNSGILKNNNSGGSNGYIGIQNLYIGDIIVITTNGNSLSAELGCSLIEEMSVGNEFYFTATADKASIFFPHGTYNYVKTITVYHKNFTKTLGTTGFGTFSAACPVTVPAGVTVYESTLEGETLTATPCDATVIPTNTGVIFKAAENAEVTFVPSAEAGSAITTALTAAPNGVDGDGATIFGLLKNENTFAKVMSGVTLAANSAYLSIPASAKNVRMVIGGTTGIENVASAKATNKAVKRIMNGQLVIEKAGKMFNAAGAQVK